ncbi:MAG: tRNA (N(6)-L-threonylcarbamoyladenosine(37)-C(2))-methylthiotransferase MtaB [Ruminococcus sp.]|nr:tRNA (N(6)-L-threonylcarbamoyladenosine(37)-C(2))-methylthiotransferase MtaB [Ruminococcus sp.]
MRTFYMTFGCKVNQYETNCIEQLMTAEGFVTTNEYQSADVAVINTCTVTSSADSKCRQFIRKIAKENPSCIICALGCMTQTAKSADILPECAVIAGSRNKTALPSLIKRYIAEGERIFAVNTLDDNTIEPMCSKAAGSKTRAYIKIQDGCEMYCTYCAIPYARGKLSSKPLDEIKTEAKALIAAGHKELILTGINLCCYGRELKNGTRLIDAIEAVCTLEGDFRVRLSSVEPEMITKPDIERMVALDKLCPHFHLSLQSGCDKTLKAMKRHYDTDMYSELVENLRESFDNCAITTDIMVGFPGETAQDHEQALSFARQIAFADGHIFPYSRRKGTPADKMPQQVDKKNKHARALEMAKVISESREAFLASMVGKTVRVLFEKESSPLYHQGHSDNYTLVKIDRLSPETTLRRQMRDVKITSHDGSCCYGVLVQ